MPKFVAPALAAVSPPDAGRLIILPHPSGRRTPRIDDFDPAPVKIRDVAGGKDRTAGPGDCGNLGVRLRNRPAGLAAGSRQASERLGRELKGRIRPRK